MLEAATAYPKQRGLYLEGIIELNKSGQKLEPVDVQTFDAHFNKFPEGEEREARLRAMRKEAIDLFHFALTVKPKVNESIIYSDPGIRKRLDKQFQKNRKARLASEK